MQNEFGSFSLVQTQQETGMHVRAVIWLRSLFLSYSGSHHRDITIKFKSESIHGNYGK